MPRVAGCLLLLLLVSLASGDVPTNEELNIPSLAGPLRHLQVRPVASPSDQIQISVGISLLDADVHEADNTVTLGGWLQLSWTDHRVSWSEGAVKSTRVTPDQLWTPDLSLYSRIPVTSEWVYNTPVIVYPSGKVIYVPAVSFTVRCQRNQTDDHDRITCPFKLGSWTHNVEEMDLVLKNDILDTSDFINNGRWVVESSSLVREEKFYTCCVEAYLSIQGEVVLKPQRS